METLTAMDEIAGMNRSDRVAMSHPSPSDASKYDVAVAYEPKVLTPEQDPSGLKPSDPGAKLDDGKVMADLLEDFGLALLEVAKVGTFGANKYSRGGWQHVENAVVRYNAAKWRHLLKGRYESHDPDSGLLHAAHEAWNVLAKLELMLREKGL